MALPIGIDRPETFGFTVIFHSESLASDDIFCKFLTLIKNLKHSCKVMPACATKTIKLGVTAGEAILIL